MLQRDIEAHGRIVSSVVKLGERVSAQNHERPGGSCSQNPALRVVSSLEHRWHLLFLRALEWQCHIETLALSLCKVSNANWFLSLRAHRSVHFLSNSFKKRLHFSFTFFIYSSKNGLFMKKMQKSCKNDCM